MPKTDTIDNAPNGPKPFANKGNLTQGDIKSHLIRLTLPMSWGIMAIISFQLVDMYYVSLLGGTELAALSFTFPITMAIFSLFIGFQIATSSVISRLIGAGDLPTVHRFVLHALFFVFTIGLLTTATGFYFHDQIFTALGADKTMIPMIWDYMSIWFMSAVFITIPMIGNATMRASGDSMTPAIIMVSCSLINLILDPILIFGLFGFPRLEIQGAAIATIFSNIFAAGTATYFITIRKNMCASLLVPQLHLLGNSAKRFFIIALPAGLTSSIQPLIGAFILSFLSTYGTEAVAAYGIATRVEAFCFIILMALSMGMAPIIGQNWGANNHDRVFETLRLSIRFSVLWSLGIAVILGLLAQNIASTFSQDPITIQYASLFFWIIPISYMFGNLIMGWGSAFNAMGMPQRSLIMIVTRMIIMLIPAIYIGEYFYGVTGIFIAISTVNILAGTAFHILNWKKCRAACESKN